MRGAVVVVISASAAVESLSRLWYLMWPSTETLGETRAWAVR